MKTINILAPANCVISSLFGIIDFTRFCNTFWKYLHPDNAGDLFRCEVYSIDGNTIQDASGFSINARSLEEYQSGDAVFLVSAFAHNQQAIETYIEQVSTAKDIIQAEFQADKLIASYCTGTFGIAAAGILDDAPATTVWWLKNLFGEYFPKVHLTMDELVVCHNNVITGGATTSYFNVCMTILEKMTNEIFAMQMSKLLLLDKQRLSQQPFIDSSFILNKKDKLVEDIQDWMIKNYSNESSLDMICHLFAVSKRTLIRRFKNACGETPLNYLQKIRVEKAKHYLESTNLSVDQIVHKVGYEDVASFRKLFTALTQLSPKKYRERFSYGPSAMVTMGV